MNISNSSKKIPKTLKSLYFEYNNNVFLNVTPNFVKENKIRENNFAFSFHFNFNFENLIFFLKLYLISTPLTKTCTIQIATKIVISAFAAKTSTPH